MIWYCFYIMALSNNNIWFCCVWVWLWVFDIWYTKLENTTLIVFTGSFNDIILQDIHVTWVLIQNMAEEDQHSHLTLVAYSALMLVAYNAIYRNITSFIKFNEGIFWKEWFRRLVWTLRNWGTHSLKASWSPSTVICFMKELIKVSFKGTNDHVWLQSNKS